MVSLFKKMRQSIEERITRQPALKSGLYIAVLFPITFSFLLTFAGSRIFSRFLPQFYIEWSPGLHVHHFTYGFLILALAGYLALIHHGPRANYWISWLFGAGLGLAMDELGMWLRLRDDDITRWSYDGFTVVVLSFVLIMVAKPGIRFFKNYLWPFGKNN